jgi:predicted CXXCH cytochrome family protein
MCASCHGAHGSPQKALLKKSAYEICETCHTEVHARHQATNLDPVTGQPANSRVQLPSGFPVRKKDGKLGCVGCHQPHGSDNQLMWNADMANFCVRCHAM